MYKHKQCIAYQCFNHPYSPVSEGEECKMPTHHFGPIVKDACQFWGRTTTGSAKECCMTTSMSNMPTYSGNFFPNHVSSFSRLSQYLGNNARCSLGSAGCAGCCAKTVQVIVLRGCRGVALMPAWLNVDLRLGAICQDLRVL